MPTAMPMRVPSPERDSSAVRRNFVFHALVPDLSFVLRRCGWLNRLQVQFSTASIAIMTETTMITMSMIIDIKI